LDEWCHQALEGRYIPAGDIIGRRSYRREDFTLWAGNRCLCGVGVCPRYSSPETRQRIVLYRKLAQLSNAAELAELRAEIRDRFGPIPKPVERLLGAAELKVLAAAKNVTGIEAKGDKIMLTRNGDLITLGGKFPRFTKRSPDGRLAELRNLIKAL
jgi:hypothetical protein